MAKTVVVFGAGTGLGSSIAHRFGREGYQVALVARNEARLAGLVTDLAAAGVEAAAFTADLARTSEVPELVERISARFGSINVIEFAPITTELFTPAAQLTPDALQHFINLYLLTPVEIVRTVLPQMLDRGDGGILVAQGSSAVHGVPNMSGVGPAMAATRNYIQSLHGELADQGVYAGVLHVGAMIIGSAGHLAMTTGEMAAGLDLDQVPTIHPTELAEIMWTMLAKRERAEEQAPA